MYERTINNLYKAVLKRLPNEEIAISYLKKEVFKINDKKTLCPKCGWDSIKERNALKGIYQCTRCCNSFNIYGNTFLKGNKVVVQKWLTLILIRQYYGIRIFQETARKKSYFAHDKHISNSAAAIALQITRLTAKRIINNIKVSNAYFDEISYKLLKDKLVYKELKKVNQAFLKKMHTKNNLNVNDTKENLKNVDFIENQQKDETLIPTKKSIPYKRDSFSDTF